MNAQAQPTVTCKACKRVVVPVERKVFEKVTKDVWSDVYDKNGRRTGYIRTPTETEQWVRRQFCPLCGEQIESWTPLLMMAGVYLLFTLGPFIIGALELYGVNSRTPPEVSVPVAKSPMVQLDDECRSGNRNACKEEQEQFQQWFENLGCKSDQTSQSCQDLKRRLNSLDQRIQGLGTTQQRHHS